MGKKLTSICMAIVLVVGLCPTVAAAKTGDAQPASNDALTSAITPMADEASDEPIAEGTSGTCTWKINSKGNLVIKPTSGETGVLENWGTGDDSYPPWHDHAANITTATIMGTVKAPECFRMFSGCSRLSDCKLRGLDTSNSTSMKSMFDTCRQLMKIDLKKFDTSQVVNMSDMFNYCVNLNNVDLSNFDTSKVTDMSRMFRGCHNMENWNLSSFDTTHVTDMRWMFESCHGTQLDIESFKTPSLKKSWEMFSYSTVSEIKFNPEEFDTSKVEDLDKMFFAAYGVKKLDLSRFNSTATGSWNTNANWALEGLDISSENLVLTEPGNHNRSAMVRCDVLRSVKVGKKAFSLGGLLPDTEINGHADWYSTYKARKLWETSKANVGPISSSESKLWFTPDEIADGWATWFNGSSFNRDTGDVDVFVKGGDISEVCDMTPIADARYTGSPIDTYVTLYDGFYELVEGLDYKREVTDNIGPGKAKVTITGLGGTEGAITPYTGTIAATFSISDREQFDLKKHGYCNINAKILPCR